MGRTNINSTTSSSPVPQAHGPPHKRELVDLALKECSAKIKSILALEGKFSWHGDLDTLREGL